jgi:magnesium chelatase family protein
VKCWKILERSCTVNYSTDMHLHAPVYTYALETGRLVLIRVETSIQRGLPDFQITGLPSGLAHAAKLRTRAAIRKAGYSFPKGRVLVNMPIHSAKVTSHIELAIMASILVSTDQLPRRCGVYLGELGITGVVQPLAWLSAAQDQAEKDQLSVYAAHDESPAQNVLTMQASRLVCNELVSSEPDDYAIDLISCDQSAKRIALIALVGKHPLILSGPPGVGKSSLAYALTELLPSLPIQARHSAQLFGAFTGMPVDCARPQICTVSSHSSLSYIDRLITSDYAHMQNNPVLLDELPTYTSAQLLRVRTILDEVSKQGRRMVIATRNYCPCGRTGTIDSCICTYAQKSGYMLKLSAPLLDRFSLEGHIRTGRDEARRVGKDYRQLVEQVSKLHSPTWQNETMRLLTESCCHLALSRRAEMHMQRVAESIALIDGDDVVNSKHVYEALQYRVQPLHL